MNVDDWGVRVPAGRAAAVYLADFGAGRDFEHEEWQVGQQGA